MTGRERRVVILGGAILVIALLGKTAITVAGLAADRRSASEQQDVLLDRTRAVAQVRDRVDSLLGVRTMRLHGLSDGLLPDQKNGGPIGSLAAVLNVWGIESNVIIERTEIVVDTLGLVPRIDVRFTCTATVPDLVSLLQRIEHSDLILSVRQFDIVHTDGSGAVRSNIEVSAWMRVAI